MSRTSTLAIITSVFLGLTWITFFVRVWVRIKLVKKVGMDDKWMVAAQILYTVFTTMTLIGTHYGFGKHTTELSNENKMLALKYWWLGEITYSLAAGAAKIAICLFLLRVVFQKVYKWIIYITMSIAITYSIFFLLVVVLQCLPPSYYWDKNQTGRCSSPDLIVGTSVTYGVVCMATDFTIGTIPIFIVRHLQMNTRTKLAVTGVLAMATVASLATVIRFPYLPKFRDTKDFLWESYGISLWSNIEPGMGIVAGNLATMRPLLQRVVANTTRISTSLRSRQGHHSPKHPSKQHPVDPLHSNAILNVTRPAGAHIDHNYPKRRDDNFTFFRHGDPKDVEYGVHVWHSDSKEELVDINGDVELGGSIFQKSELIVREETIDTLPDSPHK